MRNIFFHLLLISIGVFLGGCFNKQPLPYEYEGWKKLETPYFGTDMDKKRDEIEVQKALLECGFQSPIGDISDSTNHMVLKKRCMEKAGFRDYSFDKILVCDRHPNLTACQLPLSAIPDRNITMRLTSKWCQHYIYKTYPECQTIDVPITLPPPKKQDKTIYQDNTSWKLQQQIQMMNNDAMDKKSLKAPR